MKRKFGQFWSRWAADLLLFGGAVSITAGAAMKDAALGCVIGGVLAILGALLIVKGGGPNAV